MEEIGGLIPVNPHPPQIISHQIVERVTGQEAQAIRDPVRLVGRIVVVGLGALSKIPNGIGALLIGAGPDPKGDAVEGVGWVLLEDEGVVDTVRLTSSRADFNIMRETSLGRVHQRVVPHA